MQTICVYCASSTQIKPTFFDAAERLGKIFAETERGLEHTGCGSSGKYFEIKDEDYELVDPPTSLDAIKYKKNHDCKRSGCTVCVAFEH